jgi:hypothetical protein
LYLLRVSPHLLHKESTADNVADPGSGASLTPGSGIWDLGWGKSQDPDPGFVSGMNNRSHISGSLETIFWVKIFKIFYVDPRPGIQDEKKSDPGWKKLDPGSGINNPDPQHCVITIWRIIFSTNQDRIRYMGLKKFKPQNNRKNAVCVSALYA